MQIVELEQFVGQNVSHCRIERLLSSGRMSAVYRGRQLRPNRPVACTLFLLPDICSAQTRQIFRERFLRLCPTLITLRHPHLLPLYAYGEWKGQPYLLTPYRTEGSVATTLQRQGSYTPAQTVTILEQVAAGLEYAHRQGLVHGMLTSAHLLVSADQSIQVAGLGLLPLLQRHGLQLPTKAFEQGLSLAGTPLVPLCYLDPCSLQGQPSAIHSDIYSLAVILLELLAGQLLQAESNPLTVLEQQREVLGRSLEMVLRRALANDPQERFPRVGELLAAWAAAVEQGEVSHERIGWKEHLSGMPASGHLAESGLVEDLLATDGIPWQSSPPGQLQVLVQTKSVQSSHSRKKHTRRNVTAALVVVGVVGAVGISLASLLKPEGSAPMASHSTVIGHTSLPPNSALAFNDLSVAEKRQRLLLHLSNGSFVAYKQGCTHSGVLVTYDSQTQMLVCPAHGAIFDPAHGGRVVRGPATLPLPQVNIHVQSDGAITL